ncbi:MAG: phosphotransferase [Pseudomonadota bacterium]
MASTLSQSITNRLNAALDTWPEWRVEVHARPEVKRKLAGFTNDNFLIVAGDDQFSLRLNTERVMPGINRAREREVLNTVAQSGLIETPVYWGDDCLVSLYLPGDYPDLTDVHTLVSVGRLFREIHEIAVPIDAVPIDDVLEPLSYAESLVEQNTNDRDMLESCLDVIRGRYLPPVKHCLCHNDLSRENLIESSKGLVAIDWEYARLGDPAFDVAVVAEMSALTDLQLDTLTNGYGREANLSERLPGARLLYALIEILWWRAAEGVTVDVDEKLSGLKRRLSL